MEIMMKLFDPSIKCIKIIHISTHIFITSNKLAKCSYYKFVLSMPVFTTVQLIFIPMKSVRV